LVLYKPLFSFRLKGLRRKKKGEEKERHTLKFAPSGRGEYSILPSLPLPSLSDPQPFHPFHSIPLRELVEQPFADIPGSHES